MSKIWVTKCVNKSNNQIAFHPKKREIPKKLLKEIHGNKKFLVDLIKWE